MSRFFGQILLDESPCECVNEYDNISAACFIIESEQSRFQIEHARAWITSKIEYVMQTADDIEPAVHTTAYANLIESVFNFHYILDPASREKLSISQLKVHLMSTF